ncbi:hypothetical protein OGAPHI_002209 [Ogataea philodendri]|uniref:Uncharacterized protein n=1 Tax=Ogataea philodendri TaxID=1378263 RepID=A0A9P8PBD6_9ASCO|nr:uncharacterized protein OGAPHI_002209 [Ogataea philodendri]KAH3668455.1 hypothetical protein OGAPHI_002209 [Ogataea philodendri]
MSSLLPASNCAQSKEHVLAWILVDTPSPPCSGFKNSLVLVYPSKVIPKAILTAAWVTRMMELAFGNCDSTLGINLVQNSRHLCINSSSSSPLSDGTTVSGGHLSDRSWKYCDRTAIFAGSGMVGLFGLYHSPIPLSRKMLSPSSLAVGWMVSTHL